MTSRYLCCYSVLRGLNKGDLPLHSCSVVVVVVLLALVGFDGFCHVTCLKITVNIN